MNSLRLMVLKQQEGYFRLMYNIFSGRFLPVISYTTTVDTIDVLTTELLQKPKHKVQSLLDISNFSVQRFSDTNSKPSVITSMTDEKLEETIQQLLLKNKDKQVEQIINECITIRKLINDKLIKILFKHYSNSGRTDIVLLLQRYSSNLSPSMYKRNGEFSHFYAKAQCLRGNSDKGLSILKDCYKKYVNFRSYYRVLFRELIQDSVLNRSEASLVVFKKYVIEFSEEWEEHYPLVCLWHICWSSSWYSDQMLADELWNASEQLRNILQNKVAALSITALRMDYNEDAVIRMLQALLKHQMMAEYITVLQVLFEYKLKNRDIRGCTEIIRNCEVLEISLSSDQQRKYIKLLIFGHPAQPENKQPKPPSKEFKLKF